MDQTTDIEAKLAAIDSRLNEFNSVFYKNNFSELQVFDKQVHFNNATRLAQYAALPTSAEMGQIAQVNGQLYVYNSSGQWIPYLPLYQTYTAGESLTAGRLGVFKYYEATWGNGNTETADRDTTAVCSSLTWVNEDAPTTNYGTANPCYVGVYYNGSTIKNQEIFGKIDLTSAPPGLPAWNETDRVYFRIYITNASGTGAVNMGLKALDTSFTEGAVTWNTKPTTVDTYSTSAVLCSGYRIPSDAANVAADGQNPGYVQFDITEMYRAWSAGLLTNNGFRIAAVTPGNTGLFTQRITIGGRSATGGGSYETAPYISELIFIDNPGAGNTITANDGKIYHASNADSYKARNFVGIIADTVSAGASVRVVPLMDGVVYPGSYTAGRPYYLDDTTGGLATRTNNVPQDAKYSYKIGTGTGTGLILSSIKEPIFLRSINMVHGVSYMPPVDATNAIIVYNYNAAGKNQRGLFTIDRRKLTATEWLIGDEAGIDSYHGATATWTTGTSGAFSVGLQEGATGDVTVYFFK